MERNLQPLAAFLHKCSQLYETMLVRHGLMLVGGERRETRIMLIATIAQYYPYESL